MTTFGSPAFDRRASLLSSPANIANSNTGGGGGAEVIPFTFDANSYWYDPTAADCIVDTLGDDTISWIKERCAGYQNIFEPIKSRQPLKKTGGIDFNQATDRRLRFEQFCNLTNGKNGLYVSVVLSQAVAAQGDILNIPRAASTAASRCNFYMGASRLPSMKGGASENATLSFIGTAPAVTLNTKNAIELLWDFDADTFTMWIGGVQQTLANKTDAGPWSNYPSTDPIQSGFSIGNAILGGTSLSGLMTDLKIYDGVPSGAIRSSMSAHSVAKALL